MTEHNKNPLGHLKEGLFGNFTSGNLIYQFGGVKSFLAADLNVDIRVGDGVCTYFDSLDLHIANGRTAFAQVVAQIFNTETAQVEQDLDRILENLEKERDRQLSMQAALSDGNG